MLFIKANFYGRYGAVAGAIALLASCGGGGGSNNGGVFFPVTTLTQAQPDTPVVQPDIPAVAKQAVGGTVTGMVGTLVLQNNAGDDLQLTADGKFSFASGVAAGSNYAVSVRTQPFWQFCAITKGSGTATADVSDVAVSCSAAVAQVSTLAGSGRASSVDGLGEAASLNDPYSIIVDKNGGLTVSEVGGNRIRKVTANGGVTTFAGNSSSATLDGNGTTASFNELTAIGLAPSGDFYAAEFSGNVIRKITLGADVSVFAGTGTKDSTDAYRTNATFANPIAMTIDGTGNIFLAELNSALIRKITPDGDVITLAGSGSFGYVNGTGSAAKFSRPYGIAVDAAGNLFVADSDNNVIRKVTPARLVSTFAGTGAAGFADGAAGSATFERPGGLAFDVQGNLYVADTGNSLLRKITPAGVVSTLAGQAGVLGYQNGIGSAAIFRAPSGVAVGADGTIYVADTAGNRIRKVVPVAAP